MCIVRCSCQVRHASSEGPLIRLDPRAPLVVDTRDLGRRAGSMLQRSRTVPAPVNLGLGVIAVPEGSDLEVDLRLEAVVEGVLVSATARVNTVGECVRCLDPVVSSQTLDFQELYFYPDVEADDGAPRLEGDFLDLEPELRDAVVLALPLQPVCRPDCPGLCPDCGVHLADQPEHHHEVFDSRWAALADTKMDEAEIDDTEKEG